MGKNEVNFTITIDGNAYSQATSAGKLQGQDLLQMITEV